MFDFAWSEFALIGVLALVLIGPKDLPVAIKAASQALKKARRMAGEFQTHVDDLVREANLQEVRDGLGELRKMDIKNQILKHVDGDGSIRSGLSNPLTATDISPLPPPVPVQDLAPTDVTPTDTASTDIALTDTVTGHSLIGGPLDEGHLAAGLSVDDMILAEPSPELAAEPPPAFVPPSYGPKAAVPIPPAFVPPSFARASKLSEHA